MFQLYVKLNILATLGPSIGFMGMDAVVVTRAQLHFKGFFTPSTQAKNNVNFGDILSPFQEYISQNIPHSVLQIKFTI
jgi:hypothetical protein